MTERLARTRIAYATAFLGKNIWTDLIKDEITIMNDATGVKIWKKEIATEGQKTTKNDATKHKRLVPIRLRSNVLNSGGRVKAN